MELRLKRLRLVFEDSGILRKSQRAWGLQRSWILLPSSVATVSDLARYVAAVFKIRRPIAGDLLFSMEGFVLPSYESTAIIEDKDIVSVRMKGSRLIDFTSTEKNIYPVEGHKLLTLQHIISSDNLLTGAETKDEEVLLNDKMASNGKRKCSSWMVSNYLNSSSDRKRMRLLKRSGLKLSNTRKKKRQKFTGIVKPHNTNGNPRDEGADLERDPQCPPKSDHCDIELHKEDNSSLENDGITKMKSAELETVDKSIDLSNPYKDRHNQQPEICKSPVREMLDTSATRKTNSRSARRKKAKKTYLRSMANSHQVEQAKSKEPSTKEIAISADLKDINQNVDLACDVKRNGAYQESNMEEDADTDEEVIPVVIRPGHIRFEPIGATEKTEQQPLNENKTLQWNGTTDKKKGQKWGRESSSHKKSSYDDYYWNASERTIAEEEAQPIVKDLDFERLPPLQGHLKGGDVVAYRLVELSPSMCPELSSFRVGKVESYDPKSSKIALLPVPEHPISHEGELQSEFSAYREDGYLEIDFQSLIDVRSLIADEACGNEKVQQLDVSSTKGLDLVSQSKGSQIANEEKPDSCWEKELQSALDHKKRELNKNNSRGSWSFRALRGSALGPTIALLRDTNALLDPAQH